MQATVRTGDTSDIIQSGRFTARQIFIVPCWQAL